MQLRSLVLLGLCAGCATTAPVQPTASSPAKDAAPPKAVDLQALAARELEPLAPQAFTAPDDSLMGKVEAAGAPTLEEGDGYVEVNVPVGTQSPVQCYVYAQPLDAGAALWHAVSTAARSPKLQVRLARATDVVDVGGQAAVYAEMLYTAETEKGTLGGQMKLMVFDSPTTPLLCLHDEVGYSASFKRITTGLAGSLRSASAEVPPTPLYEELHVVRLAGQPVGFEKRSVQAGQGGQRVEQVTSMVLVPRSPTELLAEDTVSVEVTDQKGALTAKEYVKVTNGELSTRMSLKGVKGAKYHYEGTHSGKPLSGDFTARAPLATESSTARAVRDQLLAGKVKELRLESYEPSANPAAPTAAVLRRSEAGEREVAWELGPVKFTTRVDAAGRPERLVLPLGAMEMSQERVSARGTP